MTSLSMSTELYNPIVSQTDVHLILVYVYTFCFKLAHFINHGQTVQNEGSGM